MSRHTLFHVIIFKALGDAKSYFTAAAGITRQWSPVLTVSSLAFAMYLTVALASDFCLQILLLLQREFAVVHVDEALYQRLFGYASQFLYEIKEEAWNHRLLNASIKYFALLRQVTT